VALPSPGVRYGSRTGLSHGIRDDPDDDAQRLVFADWLEERGDWLGTLMRLQVETWPLPPPGIFERY